LISVIIGALAAVQLPRAFCLEALIGLGVVWLVGAALPLLTHAAPVLNLHLLRSSGSIQLVVTLATVSLTTLWLTRETRWGARPWGLVAVFALTTSKLALPILLAPLWAARARRAQPAWLERIRLDLLALPILLVSWLAFTVGNERANAAIRTDIAKWRELGSWARAATAPDAVFLLPVANPELSRDSSRGGRNADARDLPMGDGKQLALARGSEVFQYYAHRRVWANFAYGAAVMWSPGYYAEWHARVAAVLNLSSLQDRLGFAFQENIPYVVDACVAEPVPARVVFSHSDLCVFDASRRPSAAFGGNDR
jgi:hypothetical protein